MTDHAAIVRQYMTWDGVRTQREALAALDALVAERDELAASIGVTEDEMVQLGKELVARDKDAFYMAKYLAQKERAEAAEKERDEAVRLNSDWRKEAEAQQDIRLAAEARLDSVTREWSTAFVRMGLEKQAAEAERDSANVEWHRIRDLHADAISEVARLRSWVSDVCTWVENYPLNSTSDYLDEWRHLVEDGRALAAEETTT